MDRVSAYYLTDLIVSLTFTVIMLIFTVKDFKRLRSDCEKRPKTYFITGICCIIAGILCGIFRSDVAGFFGSVFQRYDFWLLEPLKNPGFLVVVAVILVVAGLEDVILTYKHIANDQEKKL